MGQVSVKVNGYSHTIGCKDGEEDHVRELMTQIDGKVHVIRDMGGQFSESRMLLHVSLLLADELGDLKLELRQLRGDAPAPPQPDPALANRLARIAERLEGIALTLDRT